MKAREEKASPLASVTVIVLISLGMWGVIGEVVSYILRAM